MASIIVLIPGLGLLGAGIFLIVGYSVTGHEDGTAGAAVVALIGALVTYWGAAHDGLFRRNDLSVCENCGKTFLGVDDYCPSCRRRWWKL